MDSAYIPWEKLGCEQAKILSFYSSVEVLNYFTSKLWFELQESEKVDSITIPNSAIPIPDNLK